MDITKVIILAGGRGTRLPHSARGIHKVLVEIRGKTILDRQLDLLARHGLTDVRLALGFRADQIVAHLKNTSRANVEYVVENEPLGTGGGLRLAAEGLSGPFLVLNGDTIADFDFTSIIRSHQPDTALIVSYPVEDARDFGLLRLDGEWVREFLEKSPEPKSGHINAGCYILHTDHFVGVPPGHFMLEQEVLPRLARQGLMRTFIHCGFWEDAGTEERLLRLRNSPDLKLA